ncbi:hypothetical protein FJT64_014732 [Amphibalanus amphitrite]|uniref:Uncharacterized protein n=1 Tax=Amphibalanus amphitrite TaxID=1232801 RepID=A0A6A4UVS6_AMPAM|nr:hypothetical protein FJT64_014732 [Amphibalanus amphitrite]
MVSLLVREMAKVAEEAVQEAKVVEVEDQMAKKMAKVVVVHCLEVRMEAEGEVQEAKMAEVEGQMAKEEVKVVGEVDQVVRMAEVAVQMAKLVAQEVGVYPSEPQMGAGAVIPMTLYPVITWVVEGVDQEIKTAEVEDQLAKEMAKVAGEVDQETKMAEVEGQTSQGNGQGGRVGTGPWVATPACRSGTAIRQEDAVDSRLSTPERLVSVAGRLTSICLPFQMQELALLSLLALASAAPQRYDNRLSYASVGTPIVLGSQSYGGGSQSYGGGSSYGGAQLLRAGQFGSGYNSGYSAGVSQRLVTGGSGGYSQPVTSQRLVTGASSRAPVMRASVW